MEVTIYKQPHGRTEKVDIKNVRPEDADYFERHSIRISMEDAGGQFVVYADDGTKDEDEEPDELIELSQGRSCEDTLSALRAQCEARAAAQGA